MRNPLCFGSVFAALICAGVVQANEFTPDTLVVTEISSSVLTAVWDGSPLTVTYDSPDDWSYTIPNLTTGYAQWAEPDSSGDVNIEGSILGFLASGALSDVKPSRVLNFFEGAPLANDTTDTTDFTDVNLSTGFPVPFSPVDVTFNDLGDINGNGNGSLPDTTTTLPLLGMAFAGLCGFAKRFRK